MRFFYLRYGVLFSSAIVGALAACSSASDGANTATDETSTPDAVAQDATPDAPPSDVAEESAPDSSVETPAARYGLESMPVNTTCIVPTIDPTTGDGMATLLSKTGCVDPKDPKSPATGLIPYGINAPLWSDGAIKRRYFALPPGGQITIGADNDWDFPNGTVLLKTFALAAAASPTPSAPTMAETRLFVRASDGLWRGYSYQWNDAQTDATLIPSATIEVTKTIGKQLWKYPTREACMRCHNSAPNWSLGLETAQLNGDFTYPSGIKANQIETLAHIGAFVTAPVDSVATLPRLAGLDDPTATDEQKARAYLHSNCSHCHRPGGPTPPSMDWRYANTLTAAKACGSTAGSTFGVAGMKLLKPGDPVLSLIYRRQTDLSRMPPLAVSLEDTAATKMFKAWITALTSCTGTTTGDVHAAAAGGDAGAD